MTIEERKKRILEKIEQDKQKMEDMKSSLEYLEVENK